MTIVNIPGLGTFDSNDIQCAGNCFLGDGQLWIVAIFKKGGFLYAPSGCEEVLKSVVQWKEFGGSSTRREDSPPQDIVSAYRFVTILRLLTKDGQPFFLWVGINKAGAYTVELHSGADEELLREMSSRAHRATEKSLDAESTSTPKPSVERAPESDSLGRKLV